MGHQGSPRRSQYLVSGRLQDVLALIQVLALDEHAHRSEKGLAEELQGPPHSSGSRTAIAMAHPEFFRVNPAGERGVSLVAKHVTPRDVAGQRTIPAEYVSKLLTLAVDLHDHEMRRAEAWQVWIPIIVAVTAGGFTLFGIWLKTLLGGATGG